ncbi:MAG: mercury transporter [Acidiphilium sp.]|jgi:mercuric ion binding protein|nr:mercury transporter [Acidiphilium sp.]MDD4934147.1 mercury transporter [Acidiphilium sp.]
MKTRIGIFAALGMLLAPIAAQAGQATVVLDVHHAGCVLCGPIVKSTLTHVKGVTSVSVSQADGNADVTATVTYDNAQTSPAAMIKATTGQGYPAEISKLAKN